MAVEKLISAEGAKSKADGISTAATMLLQKVSEAQEPVQDLGPPHLRETPADLHNRLLVTRACMSRVSELVAQTVRLRNIAVLFVLDAEGQLQESEARVMETRSTRPSLSEDYSSAKERNAKLAVSTLEEHVCLRQARRAQIDTDSVLEYARNRLWELDRAVRDIDTRLRILVYEPNIS